MRDTPQARNRAGILMPIKENEIGRKSILKYFQRAMLGCVGCHLLSLTVSNNILCVNIIFIFKISPKLTWIQGGCWGADNYQNFTVASQLKIDITSTKWVVVSVCVAMIFNNHYWQVYIVNPISNILLLHSDLAYIFLELWCWTEFGRFTRDILIIQNSSIWSG